MSDYMEITGSNKPAVIFDTKKLTDKISEVVKEKFADLVTKEQWDSLVTTEINTFFDPKEGQFKKIVSSMLEDKVRADMKALIQGQPWGEWATDKYGNQYNSPTELAKEITKEVAPQVIEAFAQKFVADIVRSMASCSY